MAEENATHYPAERKLLDSVMYRFLSKLATLSPTIMLAGLLAATSAQAQTLSVLYTFTGGADGKYPSAGVIRDSLGNLCGTTINGGAYDKGTVFRLSPTGHKTTLYSFRGKSGAYPNWNLIPDSQGSLYGTTTGGGNLACLNEGCGTVFKLDKAGKLTVLHSFSGAPDGFTPSGLVRDAAGNFYGVTEGGGAIINDYGTVYKLDPSGNLTVLHTFTGGSSDGASPLGALVRDSGGNLYGATASGGSGNFGTVFKLDSSGNESVLHIFTDSPDGYMPFGGVVRDSAGNLYGTTVIGGLHNSGTIFKVEPSGAETVLHSFGSGTDGGYPDSRLIRDTGGNFYGVTTLGGDYGWGTVYKLDSSNNVTLLYSFTGKADGKYPIGTLTRDSAGDLYGVTQSGGVYGSGQEGWGVVFKLTP